MKIWVKFIKYVQQFLLGGFLEVVRRMDTKKIKESLDNLFKVKSKQNLDELKESIKGNLNYDLGFELGEEIYDQAEKICSENLVFGNLQLF